MYLSSSRRLEVQPRRLVSSLYTLARTSTLALIVAGSFAAQAVQAQDAAAEDDGNGADIVVTARKQKETAQTVPLAITAFSDKKLEQLEITSFGDYATKTPGLAFAYGTGNLGFTNSRTVSVRGVVGTNTTGVYIDDTPVFDTMDPRVVDLERIEVLKGPQGTLYGSGSMGGTVRLVTKQPDLEDTSYRLTMNGGYTAHGGSPDYGGEFLTNQVITPGVAAIRVLGFYDHEGGYLTRTFSDGNTLKKVDDQGRSGSYGGSVSLRVKPTDAFTIDARVLYQNTEIMGFPAAYAPLPDFEVKSFTLNREQDLQEVSRDWWVLPSLTLNYAGDGFTVTSSTSFFKRKVFDREDSTEATKSFLELYGYTPSDGPITWTQDYTTKRFTQELRLSYDKLLWTSGVIGGYYSHLRSSGGIPYVYAPGLGEQGVWSSDLLWNRVAGSSQTDLALFGEIYNHITDKLTLTVGARLYKTTVKGFTDISGFFAGSDEVDHQVFPVAKESGISPKVSLDYKLSNDVMLYASASRGFRPGGSGNRLPDVCSAPLASIGYTQDQASTYDSDSVWSYEAGVKTSPMRHTTLNASAFQIDWSNIQQVVYLNECGFSFVANSGAARIRGFEVNFDRSVIEGLSVNVGLAYQDAVITDAGSSPRPVGSRLLQVPKFNLTSSLVYSAPLSDTLNFTASADYSRTGNSLSQNSSTAYTLVRPAYDVVNARVALEFGPSEFSIYAKNLFNSKANLGDIQYIGLAQTEADGSPYPRVATLRPFQVGAQYRVSF